LLYWDVSNATVDDIYMRMYRIAFFEESMMEEGSFALKNPIAVRSVQPFFLSNVSPFLCFNLPQCE